MNAVGGKGETLTWSLHVEEVNPMVSVHYWVYAAIIGFGSSRFAVLNDDSD